VGATHWRGKLTVRELAAKMSCLKMVGENLTEEKRALFIQDFNFDGGGIDNVDFDVPASRLATRWTRQRNLELFFFLVREKDESFDILGGWMIKTQFLPFF
jgi:hypothetical protein